MIEGTLQYEFEPLEDITTYELALIHKNFPFHKGHVASQVWTKLSEGLRRHFKITEVTYSNQSNEQDPVQGVQPNPNLLVPVAAKHNPARNTPLGPGGAGGGNYQGGNKILRALLGRNPA